MSPLALAPEALVATLADELGDVVESTGALFGNATVVLRRDAWVEGVRRARDSSLELDFLSFLSAIDWTEAEAAVEGAEAAPVEGVEEEPDEEAAAEEAGGYQPPRGELFQVMVRLSSTRHGHGVTLKTNLPKDDPHLPTLIDVFSGANWHERECHEMFGIVFDGHPYLEHLYLPEDFEGHPLLKSFLLGAREVKPWPGDVDVEDFPPEAEPAPAGGGEA